MGRDHILFCIPSDWLAKCIPNSGHLIKENKWENDEQMNTYTCIFDAPSHKAKILSWRPVVLCLVFQGYITKHLFLSTSTILQMSITFSSSPSIIRIEFGSMKVILQIALPPVLSLSYSANCCKIQIPERILAWTLSTALH